MSVISEQVKGVLDVRYLFRVKTGLVIITGETDDTVYRLTEDVARFEPQKTEVLNDKVLPRGPFFLSLVVFAVCLVFCG